MPVAMKKRWADGEWLATIRRSRDGGRPTARLGPGIQVESDCAQVIKAVEDCSLISSFDLLVNDIKELAKGFSDLCFCFVKGSANGVAHELARAVLSKSDYVLPRKNEELPPPLLSSSPCDCSEYTVNANPVYQQGRRRIDLKGISQTMMAYCLEGSISHFREIGRESWPRVLGMEMKKRGAENWQRVGFFWCQTHICERIERGKMVGLDFTGSGRMQSAGESTGETHIGVDPAANQTTGNQTAVDNAAIHRKPNPRCRNLKQSVGTQLTARPSKLIPRKRKMNETPTTKQGDGSELVVPLGIGIEDTIGVDFLTEAVEVATMFDNVDDAGVDVQ
nr:uncharacterized protein LOC109168295 [Ipomoea batatas]